MVLELRTRLEISAEHSITRYNREEQSQQLLQMVVEQACVPEREQRQ
jgi:hypothetical protein